MDFNTDMDEDQRLAIRLSEIESKSSLRNTQVTSEEEDYLYALKLSEELNAPDTCTSTFSSNTTTQLDADFLLAKRLAEADNDTPSGFKENLSAFNCVSNVAINEDYLLAVKLAGDDASTPNSSREKTNVELEDEFPNDIADSDYELALRLAEESFRSSKDSDLSLIHISEPTRPY